MVIGISVTTAALSLTALVSVVVYAVKRRAEDDEHRSKVNSNPISSWQFTIVPINGSNLRSCRVRNDTAGGIKEAGCLRSNTRSCSSSEMTSSTEFDYYDCTNDRAPVDGCHGNGGTVVHV